MPAQDILSILVASNLLTQDQASSINTESLTVGTPVEEIIKRKRLLDEGQLARARAESLGIPFVELATKPRPPDVTTYIPEPVARRYTLVPFEFDRVNNVLSVAMIDPLDFQVVEFLERKSGKSIKPFMALKDDILSAIQDTYTQNIGVDVTAALKEASPYHIKTYEAGRLNQVIREAPIAQIVSAALEQAIRIRASDVHIEPQPGDSRVRYRVDGILQERLTLPRGLHEAVVSRIKILSDMKIDEKRIPQDGRFNFKMGDQEVDLRVSTLPTVHGEKIVMRLLKKSGGIPTLADLGIRGLAVKNLENSILKPHGIILVTGPTGSGKTTTLYSVLSKLNNARVNIMTLEDPVEYQINGVNQVQINPQAGLTFATGLRAFLRQDPNIILVGEIRDTETVDLAIQAALTGHLVFSTLHTNDAAGAIPRMMDLGAEAFLIASALNAVVAQRITRRICPSCKEEYAPTDEVQSDIRSVLGPLIDPTAAIRLYRGKSVGSDGKACPTCGGSGYFGRIGIYEIFPINEAMSTLILRKSPAQEIQKLAIENGMVTMRQDGYMKALDGITTIEEVLRVALD